MEQPKSICICQDFNPIIIRRNSQQCPLLVESDAWASLEAYKKMYYLQDSSYSI